MVMTSPLLLMRHRMMLQTSAPSDIDFQIKNIQLSSREVIDTGYAPFTTARDMTICMSWDLQRFSEPTDNIRTQIQVAYLSSGNRQLECSYYYTYFYCDLFGNRSTRSVANCLVGEIRFVLTYDNTNGKAKRFITYFDKYDDRSLSFITDNGTIKIGQNSASQNTLIKELTVYNRLFTEDEALAYINS